MVFKRGQVTMFIILAILIVSIVALVFIFKDNLFGKRIPSEISPIYNTLSLCLEKDLATGVSVLESQGGYIYIPEYEAASEYMPFSSQLDFLGNPIPYWYYVSGNNIEREQVPSKEEMQKELEEFMETRIRSCSFDVYYLEGYNILMDKPEASVVIKDKQVSLTLNMDFSVSREEDSHVIKEHKIVLDSELGSLYNSALSVYEEEQASLFLEEQGVDILRSYAPVDGVEISCSPKIWIASEIFRDLQNAIEANTIALKNGNDKKEYFEMDIPEIPSKQRVRFLNSKNWSYSFEVLPSDDGILIANPVGNQQGMGILGFCYVPYHFVYSMKYPVLVQVISGEEIFQFPLAVVISRNQPRKVSGGEAIGLDKNTLTEVRVYDSNLKPVEGYVSYECLGAKCNIGMTKGGEISEEFPQCVNGFINVRADGYREESVMYSTNEEGGLSIVLTKLYDLPIQLKLDKQNYNKDAIISFVSDDYSETIVYPQQTRVKLGEGEYEVQVYIYKNSSLSLGATKQEQCVTVPRSSIFGMIGLTKEECFEVEVPAQVLSKALAGGGKQNYTFSENELKNSKVIDIYATSFPSPNSLEQMQMNDILFEGTPVVVNPR
jgi:hypothetical protein